MRNLFGFSIWSCLLDCWQASFKIIPRVNDIYTLHRFSINSYFHLADIERRAGCVNVYEWDGG